jgi:acetyl-CoA synthetase
LVGSLDILTYGPLLNLGATTIILIHRIQIFTLCYAKSIKVKSVYTATAIRAVKKAYVLKFPLIFKVIGSVGEQLMKTWHWYNDHVGGKRCH